MSTTTGTRLKFNELLESENIDELMKEVQEVCAIKLWGKTVPGMEHDDIAQEVSIKVLNAIETFDSSKATANTFISNIINNMIIDCYRKATTIKNLMVSNSEEIDEYTETGGELVMSLAYVEQDYEYVEVMNDVINTFNLTEQEKEMFLMRCEGYSFAEIAKKYGVSRPRVSQLWSGIKNKYIEYMGGM